MLKKTITYIDFNGVERTEDFYFNLTRAEILEMETGVTGGFSEMLNRLIKEQDQVAIMKIFKEFILKAYGVKSPDGRKFMKSKEIADDFAQTEAYSQLYVLLATNADEAAKFINALTPADMDKPANA